MSPDELLQKATQLDPPDLERLIQQLIALCAQFRAPRLSPPETDLFLKINQGLPEELQDAYQQLIGMSRAQTLNKEEHQQLLRLTDLVEQMEAQRMEALFDLASQRRTSLSSLMNELGITGPDA